MFLLPGKAGFPLLPSLTDGWVCRGSQSLMRDRDLRGLSLETVVQNLVELAGETSMALWFSLAQQPHLTLIQQLVMALCWGTLALEVGAGGAVYTLGMVCSGLLTLRRVP